jgi:hypothetical protein
MDLMSQLQNDKHTIVATYALVREAASDAGFELEGTIAATCESAKINRTQVYNKKVLIKNELALIEQRGRGRPPQKKHISPADRSLEHLRLEILTLSYRLEHPGAVIKHSPFRTSYSNDFKRFILGLHDNWKGSELEFQLAVNVPQKTMVGWRSEEKKTWKDRNIPFPSFT